MFIGEKRLTNKEKNKQIEKQYQTNNTEIPTGNTAHHQIF